jgi:hypothetical protein
VFTGRRLRDFQLAGDENAAHAVSDQVSISLGREVLGRVLQPIEDLQALVVGYGTKYSGMVHIVN